MATLVAPSDIPEVDLADQEYPPRVGGCSCHSIQEGAGGRSYSYAILGVNCPRCEAFMDDCDSVDSWNALTRDERIAELVRIKNWVIEYEARRAAEAAAHAAAFGGEEPPF